MSNSLSPWILEHLLSVANELGAKLFDAKPFTKKKKVQITEFLTYPLNEKDSFIWARISDKKHIATVKFTKEAVSDCQKKLTGMPRLTQQKGAIAAISKFKPICSRFPLAQNKMSNDKFIIFECGYVEILGGTGEALFGHPKGIEQEAAIGEWSKGVAQSGGAGNVLKERRLEVEGKSLTKINFTPLPASPKVVPKSTTLPQPNINRTTRKRIDDQDLKSYKARWHFLEKDRLRFIGPLPEDTIQPDEQVEESDMTNTDRGGKSERFRSATPISSWGQSPSAKARSSSPVTMEERQNWGTTTVSSSLERRGIFATPSTSLNVVNETQIGPGVRHRSMSRKVPPPASPEPAVEEQKGPIRILAPNSDTSQSQSQSKGAMQALLGGNVVDTTGQLPWMSMADVGRIMRATAELRLHNNKC